MKQPCRINSWVLAIHKVAGYRVYLKTSKAGLFIIACTLFAGCRTKSGWILGTPTGPTILRTGSREQIQETAIADARADIATGKPRIAYTGGIVAEAVGVPSEHLHLMQGLPTLPLPSRCTDPLVGPASTYAETYNKEILNYLLNKTESSKSLH